MLTNNTNPMTDTRFVYIFDLTDDLWVNAFKKIIDAEYQILDILDRTTYPLIENDDIVFDENNRMIFLQNTDLPEETKAYIDSKLSLLINNYYYTQILYYRQHYQLSFRITEESANFFGDVLGINAQFINDDYKNGIYYLNKADDTWYMKDNPSYDLITKCFIITDQNQMYYGNVWTFTRPNYSFIGMYGIKRSILDIITKSQNPLFKGISQLLINKIIEYAKENGLTKIIVINPLPPMIPILLKYGFAQYETSEETLEKQFIDPISSTYAYFTYDI